MELIRFDSLRVLGEEFERYLPAVLPSLLRSAAISPNMKVEDEDDADDEEFDGMQTVQVLLPFISAEPSPSQSS